MPWKLILFLLCIVATTFFVGFNLENSCNINLVFKTYENVPVFLTVLISFVSGIVIALLFSVGMRISSAEKKAKSSKEQKSQKVDAKKDLQNKTAPVTHVLDEKVAKKPSFLDKGKKMLAKKSQEQKPTSTAGESPIIHLDDNAGGK